MSDNPAPEKKQEPIKVGDIVVRRWAWGSGGQRMTVRRIDGEFFACMWFDELERLRESVFATHELRRVEP